MDFYYRNHRFYRKNSSFSASSGDALQTWTQKPTLKYIGSQQWQDISVEGSKDMELDRLEQIKNLSFKQWVLLKKVEGVWLQDGPYSSEDIFSRIERSEILRDALIWKKGYSQWLKLEHSETFKGIFEDLPMEPDYELLESVMEMKRAPAAVDIRTEERILKKISFSLKDYDLNEAPVHLEAKSVRHIPRKDSHVYKKYKRSFRSIYFLIIMTLFILFVVIWYLFK